METVTLKYSVGATEYSRSFNVYSYNDYTFEFEQKLTKKLDFGYVDDILGYRRSISVDFAPIENDRTTLYWLYAFLFGDSKKIQLTGGTEYTVVLDGESLDFNYLNDLYFADAFSLNFTEVDLTANTDDASTMTLTPTYAADDSTVGTYSCLLFDDESSLIAKHQFEFWGSSKVQDVGFGTAAKIVLNLRPLNPLVEVDAAKLTWLINFCQWKNKVIDNSSIFPADPISYSVVLAEPKIKFDFAGGMSTVLKTTLTFYQSTIS